MMRKLFAFMAWMGFLMSIAGLAVAAPTVEFDTTSITRAENEAFVVYVNCPEWKSGAITVSMTSSDPKLDVLANRFTTPAQTLMDLGKSGALKVVGNSSFNVHSATIENRTKRTFYVKGTKTPLYIGGNYNSAASGSRTITITLNPATDGSYVVGSKKTLTITLNDVDAKKPINQSGMTRTQWVEACLPWLAQKYPSGKYWNHLVGTVNDDNCVTTQPCHDVPHVQGKTTSWCNQTSNPLYSGATMCNLNETAIATQCMGFAKKVAQDVFGSSPNDSSKWTTYTSYDAAGGFMPGDYVRIEGDKHSVFVLGVDGDYVQTIECNEASNHCKIYRPYLDNSPVPKSYRTIARMKTGLTHIKRYNWTNASTYPTAYTVQLNQSYTFKVVKNGDNRLYSRKAPYGAAPDVKAYNVGDTVKTVQTVVNDYNNWWYKLSDGSFIWDGILEYVGGGKEYTKFEDKAMFFEVVEYPGQPCNANKVPYGDWISYETYAVGKSVTATSWGKNSFGNIWYKLDNGLYMWEGVLKPRGLTHSVNIEAVNGTVTGFEGKVANQTEKITLKATPDEGYVFNGWTATGVTLSNASSNTITFTMPNKDVTIKANFSVASGTTVNGWQNLTHTNITQTSAKLTAKIGVVKGGVLSAIPPTFSKAYLLASTDEVTVKSASLMAAMGSVSSLPTSCYYQSLTIPTPAITALSGGKQYDYTFTVNSISALKNSSGSTFSLTGGQKAYYMWVALIDNSSYQSSIGSFTTSSPSVTWSDIKTGTNGDGTGLFNAKAWYATNLTLKRVGCFVSTDRDKVNAALYNSHAGVAFKEDLSGITYGTDSGAGKRYTYVFYKAPPFDSISSFQAGVTYYYKFYAMDSNNAVSYSSIATYTPAGTATKYALTVKAGTGGTIISGSSGSYAAGNVIKLGASPNTGYQFNGWTKTAGTLSSTTAAATNFTMPSSAATVTANFKPIEYTLTMASASGGSASVTNAKSTYHYGDKLTIVATPQSGYGFSGWVSSNGGTLANASAASTTFTMPAGNVTLTPYFHNLYPVTGVTLDYSEARLDLGSKQTITLKATLSPANATIKGLTWTSSNTAVATVNNSGVVTPVAAGSATITVKTNDQSKTATCAITVKQSVNLGTGFVAHIAHQDSGRVASVNESNGRVVVMSRTAADNQFWSFTRNSDGSYTIRNGNKFLTAMGNTNGAAVSALDNDAGAASRWFIYTNGNGYHLHPASTYLCNLDLANNESTEGKNLMLYQEFANAAQRYSIEKVTRVTGLTLNRSRAVLNLNPAQTVGLSMTVAPANATYQTATLTSSNPNVARIQDGVVIPVSAGQAVITGTTLDGGKTATCNVIVRQCTDIGTDFWAEVAVANGRVLTKDSSGFAMRTRTYGENQFWHFTRQNDGSYILQSDGMALTMQQDAFGGNASNSNLAARQADGSLGQKWYLYPFSDGYYVHSAMSYLQCLDIANSNQADGAYVRTWEENTDQNAEKFQINKIIRVQGVKLDWKVETLNTQESGAKIIPVTVQPSNATYPYMIWTSSDESVAYVEEGKITVRGEGKTTITATTRDGGYSVSAVILAADGKLGDMSFRLPDGLQRISRDAFTGLPVTVVHCPEGLNFIEEDAFRNCTGLRQIVIPGNETEIDEKAFRGCGVVTVFAREGSKAQRFAEENEMPFFPLVQ